MARDQSVNVRYRRLGSRNINRKHRNSSCKTIHEVARIMRIRRRRYVSRPKVAVTPFYVTWTECAELINAAFFTIISSMETPRHSTVKARWYKLAARKLGFDVTVRRDKFHHLHTTRIWFESESAYTMFVLKWLNKECSLLS